MSIFQLFKSSCFMLFILFSAQSSAELSAQDNIEVARFSVGDLSDWQPKSFVDFTQYSIEQYVDFKKPGISRQVLKAVSHKSASGLGKEIPIDLFKTPYLNWSWFIEHKLGNMDETTKDGDDYAARIYVVKDGGWKIWKTRALNYVWSSNQDVDSRWDNAFVGDKARMLAVRGQDDNAGMWQLEKRNVYLDLIAMFGDKGSDQANEKAYRHLDAIAIMTDTDNSESSATAYYGDIYFTAQ